MPDRNPRLRVAAWAGALAIVSALGAGPAAAEDEEPTFEESIIRSLLGGGDARPDIDYRERSPLVIPPSRELPPPDTRGGIQANAAWPQDPDQQSQRPASRGIFGADSAAKREGRPLRPDELRRGARGNASRSQGPVVTQGDSQLGRPLTPAELGETKSLFGFARGITRNDPPETFTREPERRRLTQPPVGYRTPSQDQPYAPPKSSGSWLKMPNIFDRTTPSSDR